MTLRLILQSYGFFTRIISSQQETVSLIEDKMINLLIILPENEKEDDESFQICTKIREKFTLLDFQILLIVNKYRSYIIKRNHELQILLGLSRQTLLFIRRFFRKGYSR